MLIRDTSRLIRCGNHLLDVKSPVVMSILNITPDSFYPQSRFENLSQDLIATAGKMLSDGASILDIGGMSSRPGALEVSVQEEMERVIPAIQNIHEAFPSAILSVDTYRSEVAKEAIQAGATMVNDISGGNLDSRMKDVLASKKAAYVVMHMRSTPADMQQLTQYDDLMSDLMKYFVNKLSTLKSHGIEDIVIDPGFGFAKTVDQNVEVIEKLNLFHILEKPILIGVSRKSSLSRIIHKPMEDTLHATTALHMRALENGASILRVHDVGPAMDAIAIFNKLQQAKTHSYNSL